MRGPNIAPLPELSPMPDALDKRVLIKVGDNISTDHVMPAPQARQGSSARAAKIVLAGGLLVERVERAVCSAE